MIFETTQSALDQFSIGHFMMGALTFIFIYIIIYQFYKKKKERLSSFIIFITFMLTIIVSVCWEIFENSPPIVKSGLKYNNMKDSFTNMTTDILLNIIGAITVLIILWSFDYYKQTKSKKRRRY